MYYGIFVWMFKSCTVGGLITLPVVENRIGYIIAILLGAAVTAGIVGVTKKEYKEQKSSTSSDNDFDFKIEQL